MAKQRVPRTRAGGTWTEARFFGFIRGHLRNAFSRYPVKHQVKQNNRRKKRNGKRFEYHCADCRQWFPDSQIQVDHITPAGSLKTFGDLPGFCERLFCEADGLQLLCKSCHQVKTNREREERKLKNEREDSTV